MFYFFTRTEKSYGKFWAIISCFFAIEKVSLFDCLIVSFTKPPTDEGESIKLKIKVKRNTEHFRENRGMSKTKTNAYLSILMDINIFMYIRALIALFFKKEKSQHFL